MPKQNIPEEANSSITTDTRKYPPYIYFYYVNAQAYPPLAISQVSTGDYQVHVYFVENKNDDIIDNLIDDIIKDADAGRLPLVGYNVNDITLRHPGYMLFAWRENGRTLEWINFLLQNAPALKNNTFDDFGTFKKPRFLSGVYCTNKRLDKDGRPLGSNTERFEVKFITDPMIYHIHNENTSNTGP